MLLLASLPVFAAGDAYPRAKMEMKLKEYSVNMRDFTFPSGLRVILQEDHSQPLVSITSVTDRGSTSDPPGLEGIAHVVEHMWFRSIHKDADGKPLPKVWDLLEEMGANLNAFTADDQTVYMTVAPAHNLVPLLRLEGLRMRDGSAGIANEVLLIEREVVRNELRMRYENDVGAVWGHVLTRLYPKDHPYGKAAYAGIGSHDSLNAITLADIHKFFKDNYTAANTTIMVTGDFSVEKANEYLAEIGYDLMADPKAPDAPVTLVEPKPRVTGPAIEPPPPVAPAEIKGVVSEATVAKVRGPVEKPFVALGWSIPSGWRETDLLADAAAFAAYIAIASELNPSWSFGTDQALENIGCGAQPGTQGGFVICSIELKSGQDGVKVAQQAIDGLYRAWSNAESDIERRYMKNIFETSRLYAQASTLNQVDLIASLFTDRVTEAAMFAHYTGDLQYFSRSFEWVNKFTQPEMQAFAQKYLNRSRAVAVVMEPYEDGDIATDSSDAQYRGARREDAISSIMTEEQLTPEFIAKTVIPPDVSKVKEIKLDNGMKLVVMPYTQGPLLRAELLFAEGYEGTDGPLGYFARVATANRSYYLDPLRLAGFEDAGSEAFHTYLSVDAAAGNPNEALYLLRERIEQMYPSTDGRLDWQSDRKADVNAWMKDPFDWASRVQSQRLFPNHPVSRWYNHADIDAMGKLSIADVEKYWASVYRPEKATLLVVGNVTVEEVQAAAKTYFGGWAGWKNGAAQLDLKNTYPPPPAPPERQVLLFNKENASQTQISYACQIGEINADTLPVSQVLRASLDSEAWLALREQTGASYGAGAWTAFQPGGTASLGMGSLVQNDAVPLAVKSFLEIGEKAKAGKLDPKVVAVRKYSVAQQYVLGHQSTSQMLARLGWLYRQGWGLDWFEKYRKALGNVTIAQMQPMLEKCVGHEVVTAVGPVDVIQPLMDAAGMKYEVFDWKKERLAYATTHDLKSILKAEEKKQKEKEAKK
ncbi:MAG: M16 family metallopeptidase [Myxococcota bacterium]